MAAKFKVATLSRYNQTFELEKEILANAEAELTAFKAAADEELIPLLREVDALLVGRNKISAKMIDGLKACKIIVRCGIGVDNIDVAAAARRNILVSNVPDYCVDEVSDHTVALLLCTARKLLHSDKSVHAGKWGVTELSPLRRLRGQTLGIFGFGRIGRLVGEKVYPFGMRILVSDPYLTREALDPSKFSLVDFSTLLQESDYITIHSPLTPETSKKFGEPEFRKMKPSAVLINAARGEIVDEEALCRALSEKWIAGAALDALVKEPPDPQSPLVKMDNVLITPHSAWYTEESFIELHRKAAEEVARVLRGEPPLWAVKL